MGLINWDASFSTKVPLIDDQHKELIARMNSFHSAMKEGKSKEVIAPTLKFMEEYVLKHFSDEENFMEKFNCPLKDTNKKAHKEFIAKLNDFKGKHEKGEILTLDLYDTLSTWIVNHIKSIDQKMAAYVK